MTHSPFSSAFRLRSILSSFVHLPRILFLVLVSFASTQLLGCDNNPRSTVLPTQPLSHETASPDTTCECGDTITHSIVLTGDLLDCPGDGLLIVYHGPDSLVVDGAGHRIDGLGTRGSAGLRLDTTVGVRVRNCVITDFESGIRSHGGKGDIISNSELSRGEYGFWGTGSMGNQLIGNSIHDNSRAGIELGFWATNNVILGNDLSKNGYGIYAYGSSSGTTVSQNKIRDCIYGINLFSGSSHSLVESNIITGNYNGIILEERRTEYDTVRNNTLQGNGECITLRGSGRHTIENNTLRQCRVGIALTDDDYASPECQQNTIRNNLLQGSAVGINLSFAVNNLVSGNTITDYSNFAISFSSCGNNIEGNLGDQGLAIAYLTGPTTLRDTTLSQVLVCGAHDVVLDNVSLPGPRGYGLLLLNSQSISLSKVRVTGRRGVAYISGCSGIRIEDCTFTDNERGVLFNSTSNSVVTGSEFKGGSYSAISFSGSSDNMIWDNVFEGTSYYLVEEYDGSTGNRWYLGNTGNYWGDFDRNRGYPTEYVIPGTGGGVDRRPLNDEDGDRFPAWTECNDKDPLIYPGAVERCNGRDDDCDGLIDEFACPPGSDVRQAGED